jgi:UDP-2-acetamido-2-deoxy-ribo-hexuluronate aminotransferase
VIYYLYSPILAIVMRKIELVDLKNQYKRIQPELDIAIQDVLESTSFINGPAVKKFKENLSAYIDGASVIPCANGTDALQICMMALGLRSGDEVLVPAFTYAATAEVIALLGLTPRFVDVDADSFNINVEKMREATGPQTKAIVPVHLFGQCADMEPILEWAKEKNLHVIEDLAQSIGARYTFSTGEQKHCGTMGDVGAISFFPSKNLGCYGDGGAMVSTDALLAETCRIISNHGQTKLYYHDMVGVNSRLDSLQAAILDVKLKHLNSYTKTRNQVADRYDEQLKNIEQLAIPFRFSKSTHVFNQYTLTIKDGSRNALKAELDARQIPHKVYYPVPLHLQKAYNVAGYKPGDFPVAEELCETVLSIPMHTELDEEQIDFIGDCIYKFYK